MEPVAVHAEAESHQLGLCALQLQLQIQLLLRRPQRVHGGLRAVMRCPNCHLLPGICCGWVSIAGPTVGSLTQRSSCTLTALRDVQEQ